MGKTIDQVQEGIVIGNAPVDKKENLNKVIMGPSDNQGVQNKHKIVKQKVVQPPTLQSESTDASPKTSIPQRQVVSIGQIFPEAVEEEREPLLIRHFTVHNLRHTFCTRFCENETNLKVIQEIMGHADIETTMNVYAEATRDKKKESFAALEGKIKIS